MAGVSVLRVLGGARVPQRSLSAGVLACSICWITLILAGSVAAQGPVTAQPTSAFAERQHFILAIDSSGSMGRKVRPKAKQAADFIASTIFDHRKGFPTFASGDLLSLVFFSLRADTSDCKQTSGYRLDKLDYLFEWPRLYGEDVALKDVQSRDRLSALLAQQFDLSCRFDGKASPITTSEALAPLYVSRKLDPRDLFSATYVVVVTDGEYNGHPSRELDIYRTAPLNPGPNEIPRVMGTKEAVRQVKRVQEAFALAPIDELVGVGEELHAWFSRLDPLVKDPDGGLTFNSRAIGQRKGVIDIDGQSARIEIGDDRGKPIEIVFQPAQHVRPEELIIEFSGRAGGEWIKNRRAADRKVSLSLRECDTDKGCGNSVKIANEGGVVVDLLQAAFGANGRTLNGDEALPPPGIAVFQASYRYMTEGVYDFVRLNSIKPHAISFEPQPPEKLTPELSEPDSVLTNQILLTKTAESRSSKKGDSLELTAGRAAELINAERDGARAGRELRRQLHYVGIGVACLIGLACLLWFLHRRYGGRTFAPMFSWQPAGVLAIDFDQLPEDEEKGSRMLAGTLTLENQGRPRWFGRIWPSEGEPHRRGSFALDVMPERAIAVRSNPGELIGFLDARNTAPGVVRRLEGETLVHGGRWHVFVDTGAVEDGVEAAPEDGRLPCPVALRFRPEWDGGKSDDGTPTWSESAPGGQCDVLIDLLAERQKHPKVTYTPAEGALQFERHKHLTIGSFRFESTAGRRFAQPTTRSFSLQGTGADGVAIDQLLRLEATGGEGELRKTDDGYHVTLPPHAGIDCTVQLFCDDKIATNPQASSDTYSFRLRGETADGPVTGPFPVMLKRDTTPATPTLKAEVGFDRFELYWGRLTDATLREVPGELRVRRLADPHDPASQAIDTRADGDEVLLRREDDPLSVAFMSHEEPHDLLFLELGNDGRRGNGVVEFRWQAHIDDPDGALAGELDGVDTLNELILCIDRDPRGEKRFDETFIEIEGDEADPRRLKFVLNTRRITEIRSGRIEGLALVVEIGADVLTGPRPRRHGEWRGASFIAPGARMWGSGSLDEPATAAVASGGRGPGVYDMPILGLAPPRASVRRAVLRLPLTLEKLPGPHWLCIDFGTSAISAAIGTESEPYVIPLQNIVDETCKIEEQQGRNLGEFDRNNSEWGTRFLPSYIVCDADLRRAQRADGASRSASDDFIRPGFPGYPQPDLEPGKAAFVGLPASSKQIREHSGRVVYSLKSWLAQSGASVPLPTPITYRRNRREVVESSVPLDALVRSTFNALAAAYLGYPNDSPQYHAGKLVITHPNTFSRLHRERLRDCVANSLGAEAHIPAELDWRIQLVSESDAVAYFYCTERMKTGFSPPPRERILVYDFGAGTLDLSLVEVSWNAAPVYPKSWTVEGRLGVPVAGNHLDSLLARLIHRQLLRKGEVVPQSLTYRYPIVSRELVDDRHRLAAVDLAVEIGKAKRGWNGGPPWDGISPFVVSLGDPGAAHGMISGGPAQKQGKDKGEDDAVAKLPEHAPGPDRPDLFRVNRTVCLSIPARDVHDDPALKAFIQFATEETVAALLSTAGRRREDVDTVVVSGRGALWPRLRERVEGQFPHVPDTHRARLYENPQLMKEAVVRGALAWQQLSADWEVGVVDRGAAPLSVCLADGTLIEIKSGDRPAKIDLRGSATFSVLQCQTGGADKRPPKSNLRSWFFVDIFNREFQRSAYWLRKPELFASVVQTGPHLTEVRLLNSDGLGYRLNAATQATHIPLLPPWPIGSPILPPEER